MSPTCGTASNRAPAEQAVGVRMARWCYGSVQSGLSEGQVKPGTPWPSLLLGARSSLLVLLPFYLLSTEFPSIHPYCIFASLESIIAQLYSSGYLYRTLSFLLVLHSFLHTRSGISFDKWGTLRGLSSHWHLQFISLGPTLREERKGLNSTRGWAAIFHAPAEALVSPSGFLECSYGNLATEHFALNQFV